MKNLKTKYMGIELNFYQSPVDFERAAKDIEDEQISIIRTKRKHTNPFIIEHYQY